MEIREISDVPVDEVAALVTGRLPLLDAGLVRSTLDPPQPHQRHYLEARGDDGVLAGMAFTIKPRPMPEGWRMVMVLTASGLGGQGLGARLWTAVRQLVDPRAELLVTFVMDGDDPGAAAAASWGFTTVQHSVTSELDLTGLAPVPADAGDGIRLETCDDLRFDDEEAVDAMLVASQTNPEAEAGMVMTLEQLRRPDQQGQQTLAVIARVGEHPAAFSVGVADGEELHVHYTGVDPAYRGRALARRTKEFLHGHAASRGVRVAITDNEDNNAGIRHVNQQLGYRIRSGVSWMTAPGPAATEPTP